MSKELILRPVNLETMPETLRADNYYTGNDQYFKQLESLKLEIAEFASGMEPFHVSCARLHSKNLTQAAIGKQLGRRQDEVSRALKKPEVHRLKEYFIHLRAFEEGPTDRWCEQLLQRIAIDNETKDPKVAISAVRSINDIKGSGKISGGITIVLPSDLKRGPLDG